MSEAVAPPGPTEIALLVAGWGLWVLFLAEFLSRATIAPNKAVFFRRHWWQVLFLILPFLNFLRVLLLLRVARAGRLAAAAVRGSRSAAQTVRGRIGWLGALTVVVVLLSADVLYEFGGIDRYSEALHSAAVGAVAGEPTGAPTPVAKVMDVVLAVYSLAVFAALAGALGAFFFSRREDGKV